MPINLGIAVFVPSATVTPYATCNGVVSGGTLQQVINLVTGADFTTSFDPKIPYDDAIMQLDTIPDSAENHLASFRFPQTAPVGVKFAVVTSIGNTSGTNGAVTAPGVVLGDIIVRAFFGLTSVTGDSGVDVTLNFAPTAPSDGVVTQMLPISTADKIIILLQGANTDPEGYDIGINNGTCPGNLGMISVSAGDHVLYVLDITAATSFTEYCASYAAVDGEVLQRTGPTSSDILLFLLKRTFD
jgi:hypothetical protein